MFSISGAFFFGATAAVSHALDQIGQHPKVFVLDMTDVPLVDTTAARMLGEFATKLSRSGSKLYLAGARRSVRRTLLIAGLRKPNAHYAASVIDALKSARR